jgi:glycosidase
VPAPAPWWNEQVFYEVFVRSFSDSDGDGIGDLRGLIDKLDYLNDGDPDTDDDLGVTALWLMPVMQSPSYHGYDTIDYRTIEQDYGTNADFQELVAQADQRGMRVIVDLMLNHTSSEHPWFLESASGPTSPKRDWYVWSDTDPGHLSPWGTPVWHARNGAFYHGLFWEGMPDLNFRNQAVTEQMHDIARYWLTDMGVDGFRLDAVRHLIEEGDQYDGTGATHEWLAEWDDFLDTIDPDALTVGEVWDDTSAVAPYVTDDEVDVAFEFTLAGSILSSVNTGDPGAFDAQLGRVLAAYPPGQFAPFLTNHDQDRVVSQLGGDLDRAKLAASILLTLPGVPFVYYGEEIGMVGRKPDELIRTPMQWAPREGAGFTSGTPWEQVNSDFSTVNVAAQEDDPDSLLSHYRTLIHLRADHPALAVGAMVPVESSCPDLHAALRSMPDGSDTVLVAHNFADVGQRGCALAVSGTGLVEGTLTATDLLTGAPMDAATVAAGGVITDYVPVSTIGPRQSLVLGLTP